MELKDEHTLRIFISSPFNGMELERSTLSKYYWPQIEAALIEHGIHLRTVDMRWGITSESSSDSQTINICLKELDRSDMFVGFFGQRYGWHGREDRSLQENFDAAEEKYPWVNDYRARSVTELEFLHGHLNKPGDLPAVICFRNKAYDDEMRAEGVADGNKKTIYKYSAESDESVGRMNDLKQRVEESEAKTLGINMSYDQPEECAEFIFKRLWDYIDRNLLRNLPEAPSEVEKSRRVHDAIITARCGLYVRSEEAYAELDSLVTTKEDTNESRMLTILSASGYGKSALVSNWIKLRSDKDLSVKMFYHFVRADPQSADPNYMLLRLIEEIHERILKKPYKRPPMGASDTLTLDFFSCLATVEEQHPGIVLVLIIGPIDKLSIKDKTSKPVYWLPNPLPSNIRAVLFLNADHQTSHDILEVLQSEHKTKTLNIHPLTEDEKSTLCRELLNQNSKSLSPEQLTMLLSSERTSQPVFLEIVIEELCNYGSFRLLTTQIGKLLSCEGIYGLFSTMLERFESDYNPAEYEGNMTKDILGAIACCKRGLTESEIPVPYRLWAPISYAMKKLLINRNGILGYIYEECTSVIKEKYLADEESRKHIYRWTIDIFQSDFQKALEEGKAPSYRCASELSHLLLSYGDLEGLVKVISNIGTFSVMNKNDPFTLLEYWLATKMDDEAIARRYIKSLDNEIAARYASNLENYVDTKLSTSDIQWADDLLNALHKWFNKCKLFRGDLLVLEKSIAFELRRSDETEVIRDLRVSSAKYDLACLYCDTERYKESISLHRDVLIIRKRLHERGKLSSRDLGTSYHGLGACYLHLADYDEAEKCLQTAYDLQKDADDVLNICDLLSNLANVYMNKGDTEKAKDTYLHCIEIREGKEVDRISLDMAYLYNNLGLVFRAMSEFDEAEKYYQKSLKVKEKVVGRMSLDVGYSLMNLGTLEAYRNNIPKALEYNSEVLEIFKTLSPESNMVTMAEENVALGLVRLERFKDAEPTYLSAYETLLKRDDKLARCSPSLHREMVNYYAREGKWQKAGEITVALIESGIGEERDYGLLDMADSYLEVRPVRKPHLTLDAGLLRFPESPMLLSSKLSYLIPGGIKAIMEFVKTHCESQSEEEDRGKRHIVTGALLATKYQLVSEALEVLAAGKTYAPMNKALEDLIEEVKGFQAQDQVSVPDDSNQ